MFDETMFFFKNLHRQNYQKHGLFAIKIMNSSGNASLTKDSKNFDPLVSSTMNRPTIMVPNPSIVDNLYSINSECCMHEYQRSSYRNYRQ